MIIDMPVFNNKAFFRKRMLELKMKFYFYFSAIKITKNVPIKLASVFYDSTYFL